MKKVLAFIASARVAAAVACVGVASVCMPGGQAFAQQQSEQLQSGKVVCEPQETFNSANGDMGYVATRVDGTERLRLGFYIQADDNASALATMLRSGKKIMISSQGLEIFSVGVAETRKLRGTIEVMLEEKEIGAEEVALLVATTDKNLVLSAEGCVPVVFTAKQDTPFASLAPLSVLTVVQVQERVADQPAQPAVEERPAAPVQPKHVNLKVPIRQVADLPGTEFNIKNENGLFKVRGTHIQPAQNPSGNMLSVQQSIMRTKECKTAAFNMTSGGLYIYKNNGYCTTAGLPKAMVDIIKSFNTPNTNISEVALTENNLWVIIYEKSGYKASAKLPKAMLNQMNECNAKKQHFKSVVMTDDGSWAIVTNKGYWAEGDALKAFLEAAAKRSGSIQQVHVTAGGAMLAICKNGIECFNVPTQLVPVLKTLEFEPKVIKFTDDGRYIITDGKSKVEYYL